MWVVSQWIQYDNDDAEIENAARDLTISVFFLQDVTKLFKGSVT